MTPDDINELQTKGLMPMDEDKKPREFMHAHPDGDLERSDGVKCFHVIEKRAYLEAVEKYSALSLKYSDLVDKFVIQKQELNHKTEIVCGEENKTIKVEWAYVERRAYDELKLENERLKNHFDNCHAGKIITLSLQNNKQAELLTHLEQALEEIIATSHSWVITQETGAIQMPIHDSYRAIAKQALEKVKELKG